MEERIEVLAIDWEEDGRIHQTVIAKPLRAVMLPDSNGNGGLRVEFKPTRENLSATGPQFPKIRAHTIDQIEAHIDAGDVPPGAASLRAVHQVVTDGFGTVAFFKGEMSDGKPGDKFLAFHNHATNSRGIVITRENQVVLQRESRQGRVDKMPILMGIAGGCKNVSDLSKVFRSEMLQENGCRPTEDAVIYEIGYGLGANIKWGWWLEDGVFGWPVHLVIATGYEAKADHKKVEENILGVELVPLAEFQERAAACEWEDPTLILLAQTLLVDKVGRFAGIRAPHREIWSAKNA